MTNPVGRPKKPAIEKLYQEKIGLSPADWAKVDSMAIEHGFVFESKKRAGQPNRSAFIRHLVRECE